MPGGWLPRPARRGLGRAGDVTRRGRCPPGTLPAGDVAPYPRRPGATRVRSGSSGIGPCPGDHRGRTGLMKALVYHGPGQKAWEEVPDPEIVEPTDVIVRV